MANENRLIDSNKLLKLYKGWIPQLILPDDQRDKEAIEICIAVLEDQPTVDAVKVVRCKDCKYCAESFDGSPCCGLMRTAIPYVREDDFCSYGERRKDD